MPLDNPIIQTAEAWKVPTLLNAWQNYGAPFNPVGYWKDSNGVVHFRGSLAVGTIGTTMFQLPVGYRPPYTEVLQCLCYSTTLGYVPGRVDIPSTGLVYCQTGPLSGNTLYFGMDGLTFRIA
jgi:hypothetical protein